MLRKTGIDNKFIGQKGEILSEIEKLSQK